MKIEWKNNNKTINGFSATDFMRSILKTELMMPLQMDIRCMCVWDLKDGGNTVEIFHEYLLVVRVFLFVLAFYSLYELFLL